MFDMGLRGKTALVTGAAQGMGRATAEIYAEAGARLVLGDLNADGAEAVAEGIRARGGEARSMRLDVADATSVEAFMAFGVATFGSIDVACNNAAVDLENMPLAEVPDDLFDTVVSINLKGVFLCMKHEIRQMLKQDGGGAIVNIGSINSYRPQSVAAVYAATKSGLLGLTKSAAIHYAEHGIRINMVLPGAIDTPMLRRKMGDAGLADGDVVPHLSVNGRFGDPREVAEAVLWLSSSRASYSFGHALAVDGGYLSR